MSRWVKLKSIQHIDEAGKQKTYHPGDWANVGKQQAEYWISTGQAEPQEFETFIKSTVGNAGVIYTHKPEAGHKITAAYKIPGHDGDPELRYEKNLWFDGDVPVRPELVPVGFSLLDKWQICVPLYSYDVLAVNVGTEEEKEATKAIVRDLRVPLYDTRLVFIKKATETEYLFELYMKYLEDGVSPMHALLRSIYQAKPFILALPLTWNSREAHP